MNTLQTPEAVHDDTLGVPASPSRDPLQAALSTTPANAHTPGPWQYNESTGYVYDANDATVCDAYESFDKGQSDTNGRLIATAPDLLEALVDVMFRHVPFSNKSDYAEKARAAIAKATGAQQ